MTDWIEIDGRQGEGGGQILRSSLSLAMLLGRPLHLRHIRARRKKPGLLRQHLTCVRAAAQVSSGFVEGAQLGSEEVRFEPGPIHGGEYRFAIGSAGSTSLVLQTVLPALWRAQGPSTVEIEGGTHNSMAPPFGFLQDSFAPQVRRMGLDLDLELVRPGFFPAGGGLLRAKVSPWRPSQVVEPYALLERGKPGQHRCHIALAHLDEAILEKEQRVIAERLNWPDQRFVHEDGSAAPGPGNVLDLRLAHENVTLVFTEFGAPGVSGRSLAKSLARQGERALRNGAPVDQHLADQLILPLACTRGGEFVASRLSLHTQTQAEVLNAFAPGTVKLGEGSPRGFPVRVKPLFDA